MEPKPIVELDTIRHPTDEQLQHRYIFLATTIICSLSTLNSFLCFMPELLIEQSSAHQVLP